jgi:hypothetical protein
MILVKKYPHVADNQELLMKERKWITRLKATLNKRVPGAVLELGKTEYHKQRYKQYRELNKDKIKQNAREKTQCDCGCMISRDCISRHRKTKKHKDNINNLPQ